ncbi:MAG: FAD-dependent oxidoreductase [Sphingobacteriaceae bacterium]|nr:MAG: FAD-dependent oxidoreductase [Sphingobacteriaceae bacterium]
MLKRLWIFLTVINGCVNCLQVRAYANQADKYDLVVYGGTSAGVTAAIQGARMGLKVVLIVGGDHLGGLTTGGLGATDIGNKKAIGGLAHEFYQNVKQYYFSNPTAWKQEQLNTYRKHAYKDAIDSAAMWYFEPHVALAIFKQMLGKEKVTVVYHERLRLECSAVSKRNGAIRVITMESGRKFAGDMFIDATYEGDLMAMSNVSYTVGREANNTYAEQLNGIRRYDTVYNPHLFARKVDAYVQPGNPSSGLIYGVQYPAAPGREGEGDKRVQAYCFRLCLTDASENKLVFPCPENYDRTHYELLLRYLQSTKTFPYVPEKDAAYIENPVLGWNPYQVIMPNRKTDSNTKGPVSFNLVGGNYGYPEGDYATREKIFQDHKNWQMGLIWFIANDPAVPDWVQAPVKKWGLPKDEFENTGHWPPQLYIREARRMVSDYVTTEMDCLGTRIANDPVALGAYAMDSHIVSRYAGEDGYVRNEGLIGVGLEKPYPISYRSIIPKKSEATNLVVPVCVSATHAAYGSIRMEPVFMALGQSAAIAAAMAIKQNGAVQDISYSKLKAELLRFKQALQ